METKKIKNKIPLTKKILFVSLFCFLFNTFPLTTPKADAFWGEFVQENYHFLLKKIDDTITGTILGMLKQQAARVLNNQINKLVGGGGSSSTKFITNWKDYLIKLPQDQAKVYMNDYLSQITEGRGSLTGYISEGFSGSGAGESAGSYTSQLVEIAKKATTDVVKSKITYEGDPSQMFSGGNFKDLDRYLSGINNPWAFQVNAQNEFQKKVTENTNIAEKKALAYSGMIGAGEKKGQGSITNPGSVIKDAVANAQDIGNKIIAAATHPEEVISAVVSQLITKAIQQGIGQMENMIDKQVDSVTGKAFDQIGKSIQKYGPAAQYGKAIDTLNKYGPSAQYGKALDKIDKATR